jgi:virginiamycin B lyase
LLQRKYDYLVFSTALLLIMVITISAQQAMFAQESNFTPREFQAPNGTHPHDVAVDPANNGPIWFPAQGSGELGKLDPSTGNITLIPLANKSGPHMGSSAPHGIILGPDGGLWITDKLLKGIVRVDPKTEEIKAFPIPENITNNNLNTATFDKKGVLWFTDNSGYYGKLDPAEGKVHVWAALHGKGPYGITTTPDGSVYFVSMEGNYTARIDLETGKLTILEPPTKDSMPRRIWSDSKGQLWITEWNAGKLGMYNPVTNEWKELKLPGQNAQPYAIFVDDKDIVWLSDFGSNAIVRFDPQNEKFDVIPLPSYHANVRQLSGSPGQIWGAESGADRIMVIRTGK